MTLTLKRVPALAQLPLLDSLSEPAKLLGDISNAVRAPHITLLNYTARPGALDVDTERRDARESNNRS
jgi:hypothetical protein